MPPFVDMMGGGGHGREPESVSMDTDSVPVPVPVPSPRHGRGRASLSDVINATSRVMYEEDQKSQLSGLSPVDIPASKRWERHVSKSESCNKTNAFLFQVIRPWLEEVYSQLEQKKDLASSWNLVTAEYPHVELVRKLVAYGVDLSQPIDTVCRVLEASQDPGARSLAAIIRNDVSGLYLYYRNRFPEFTRLRMHEDINYVQTVMKTVTLGELSSTPEYKGLEYKDLRLLDNSPYARRLFLGSGNRPHAELVWECIYDKNLQQYITAPAFPRPTKRQRREMTERRLSRDDYFSDEDTEYERHMVHTLTLLESARVHYEQICNRIIHAQSMQSKEWRVLQSNCDVLLRRTKSLPGPAPVYINEIKTADLFAESLQSYLSAERKNLQSVAVSQLPEYVRGIREDAKRKMVELSNTIESVSKQFAEKFPILYRTLLEHEVVSDALEACDGLCAIAKTVKVKAKLGGGERRVWSLMLSEIEEKTEHLRLKCMESQTNVKKMAEEVEKNAYRKLVATAVQYDLTVCVSIAVGSAAVEVSRNPGPDWVQRFCDSIRSEISVPGPKMPVTHRTNIVKTQIAKLRSTLWEVDQGSICATYAKLLVTIKQHYEGMFPRGKMIPLPLIDNTTVRLGSLTVPPAMWARFVATVLMPVQDELRRSRKACPQELAFPSGRVISSIGSQSTCSLKTAVQRAADALAVKAWLSRWS